MWQSKQLQLMLGVVLVGSASVAHAQGALETARDVRDSSQGQAPQTDVAASTQFHARSQVGVSSEASVSSQQGISGGGSISASSSGQGRAGQGRSPINVGGRAEFPGMEVSDPRNLGDYAGVVPGEANAPPAVRRVREDRRILTWPGFQMMADGRGRFFLQTNQPVELASRSEQGRYVVILKNTRLHLRNNRRALETQFFQVPVTRAFVERRGSDLALVMELRGASEPAVRSESTAEGHYVFIEYPAWSAPVEAAPAAAGGAIQ